MGKLLLFKLNKIGKSFAETLIECAKGASYALQH